MEKAPSGINQTFDGKPSCLEATHHCKRVDCESRCPRNTAKSKWQRSVFWNHDTDDVLQRYLTERVNAGPDTCWVIPGQVSGRHMTGRNIERIVKAAVDQAGLKSRITPHSFRHAFIHRMSALGTPDAIIMQLVGHKTPQAVAHYTILSRPEGEWYARRQFASPALAA